MIFSENFLESVQKNFDAATAFYFKDELTAKIPGYLETIYAELNGFKLVPVKKSAMPGQQFVSYLTYDTYGRPEYITDLATDMPSVSANAVEKHFQIYTKALSMQYSKMDQIMGQLTSRSYIEQLAKAILRGFAQDTNNCIFFGDRLVPGWINNPNLSSSVVSNGASGSPLWASKTPDEIVEDLNDAITKVLDDSNNSHKVTTIAISLDKYRYMQTTRLGTGLQATILEQFYYCNPGVNVIAANEINKKFTGGADGFIAYVNNGDNFWYEMGDMKATDLHNKTSLAYEIGYLKSHGGVQIITPKSQIIKFGI